MVMAVIAATMMRIKMIISHVMFTVCLLGVLILAWAHTCARAHERKHVHKQRETGCFISLLIFVLSAIP